MKQESPEPAARKKTTTTRVRVALKSLSRKAPQSVTPAVTPSRAAGSRRPPGANSNKGVLDG